MPTINQPAPAPRLAAAAARRQPDARYQRSYDRWRRPLLRAAVAFALAVVSLRPVAADPCGMVPPIYGGPGAPIERIGPQITYVFYKNGLETFLIRPGFSGKVDEFGMLIPFPSVPVIRKVPDDVFQHVAAAVDPPELEVHLGGFGFGGGGGGSGGGGFGGGLGFRVPKDQVEVIRQEAIGMYDVVVLAAGSAAALKRWMDEHGYRYPAGMDRACQEYVEAGWCFVAVKTRVGQKAGIDPKPGMRQVDPDLPPGASFDGYVQGMGFRFFVNDLVVPMRLSAFNEGELRNVIYLLTDGPRRVDGVPRFFVVRQIPGAQLYRNLTDPLPVRVFGGRFSKLHPVDIERIRHERDPRPHNGIARELFASDLLAVEEKRLFHPHEEEEKELLRINERLGLRGPEISHLTEAALAVERERVTRRVLEQVRSLTLTVIDGEFPREFLAQNNLTFAPFRMNAVRNTAEHYDAKRLGPGGKKEGILFSQLPHDEPDADSVATKSKPALAVGRGRSLPGRWILAGLAGMTAGYLVRSGIRHGSGRRRMGPWMLAGLFLGLGAARLATAADDMITEWVRQLDDPQQAAAAAESLVREDQGAVVELLLKASAGERLAGRGWAIVCLSRIGGARVERHLADLHDDPNESELVRTWAAAARLRMAPSADALLEHADLVSELPVLAPLFVARLRQLAPQMPLVRAAEPLLELSLQAGPAQSPLRAPILALGPEALASAMLTAPDQDVRRQAAGFLAVLGNQQPEASMTAVNSALRFDADAKAVPWKGGPLFVPVLPWTKERSRTLLRHLIAWYLWCERTVQVTEQRQLDATLTSVGLASVAGYQVRADGSMSTSDWLKTWKGIAGRADLDRLLDEQGVKDRYRPLLELDR